MFEKDVKKLKGRTIQRYNKKHIKQISQQDWQSLCNIADWVKDHPEP